MKKISGYLFILSVFGGFSRSPYFCTVFARKFTVFTLTASHRASHSGEKQKYRFLGLSDEVILNGYLQSSVQKMETAHL